MLLLAKPAHFPPARRAATEFAPPRFSDAAGK
jgi:hypothetical protein